MVAHDKSLRMSFSSSLVSFRLVSSKLLSAIDMRNNLKKYALLPFTISFSKLITNSDTEGAKRFCAITLYAHNDDALKGAA